MKTEYKIRKEVKNTEENIASFKRMLLQNGDEKKYWLSVISEREHYLAGLRWCLRKGE